MVKCIVFDMDGVLIDSERFYHYRRMGFFDSINIEPGSREINDYVGCSEDEIWNRLVPANAQLRKDLKENYKENYLPYNKINYSKYKMENLDMLIDSLSGKVKIGIASASSMDNINDMMRELDLKSKVDFFISGEDCKYNKPNPEIYKLSIEKSKCDPEDILVIEDSYLGIEAGKKANLKVIALRPKNYKINQKEADYIIDNLIEILEFI